MTLVNDLLLHLAKRIGERIPKTAATTVGMAVLGAADAPAARSAIGAGTSNLRVGTASTDAKPGNYHPTAAEVTSAGGLLNPSGGTDGQVLTLSGGSPTWANPPAGTSTSGGSSGSTTTTTTTTADMTGGVA